MGREDKARIGHMIAVLDSMEVGCLCGWSARLGPEADIREKNRQDVLLDLYNHHKGWATRE